MDIKEAAIYLKLNYMTVYKLAQSRRLPSLKVGGSWRFKKELLDEWVVQKATLGGGPVLIVDDDFMILEMLKEMVQAQGYTVSTAGTGELALGEIDREHFDLIFLDLMLPGLKGVELLKAIKEKDTDAIIVIVTAYGDDPLASEVMELGPLFLVRKPFKEKDVIEVLDIVMKKKG